MQISFSRFDDDVARFVISGFSSAFVNAFRRTMIGEVPTLAIEDVLIYDNNSALLDEMLAHRLGLIPLKTDLSEYVFKEDCSCDGEGCSACTSVYTLSVEGPKVVYSRDLIPQDPRAAPVNEDIPLVKLEKDQKVVLEARAVLGRGIDHAKWPLGGPTRARQRRAINKRLVRRAGVYCNLVGKRKRPPSFHQPPGNRGIR